MGTGSRETRSSLREPSSSSGPVGPTGDRRDPRTTLNGVLWVPLTPPVSRQSGGEGDRPVGEAPWSSDTPVPVVPTPPGTREAPSPYHYPSPRAWRTPLDRKTTRGCLLVRVEGCDSVERLRLQGLPRQIVQPYPGVRPAALGVKIEVPFYTRGRASSCSPRSLLPSRHTPTGRGTPHRYTPTSSTTSQARRHLCHSPRNARSSGSRLDSSRESGIFGWGV